MGSGSRATRERAVLVDRRERTTIIDTSALCAFLRETFPELNLEGAALVGDEFVLLQRGNRCDDGDLLASAALEDTRDPYQDGPCLGSSLVRMAPDGALRWHRDLETPAKVEGLAVDGEFVWLVSDADDRAVPSQLLRAALS